MLINCVAYQDGKRLAEIDPKDIHRYIAMPDCFVWVAMLERDPATLEQMREEFDLHPLAVEDAQFGHQRPKIEEYGESLFAVLHLLEPDNGSLRVGEVNVFAGPNYVLTIENVEELYGLKQKLGIFRHAVAPLLEAVNNLYGARAPRVCNGMKEYFRDVSDHLQRLNQTIESIRDTIAKRLAAYGALIAVPTLIAGIYGMNFHHMPELNWQYGYLLSAAIMIGADLILFLRLRRAKWL